MYAYLIIVWHIFTMPFPNIFFPCAISLNCIIITKHLNQLVFVLPKVNIKVFWSFIFYMAQLGVETARNPLKLKKHLKFSDSYNKHRLVSRATVLSLRHNRAFLLKFLLYSFCATGSRLRYRVSFDIVVIVWFLRCYHSSYRYSCTLF